MDEEGEEEEEEEEEEEGGMRRGTTTNGMSRRMRRRRRRRARKRKRTSVNTRRINNDATNPRSKFLRHATMQTLDVSQRGPQKVGSCSRCGTTFVVQCMRCN